MTHRANLRVVPEPGYRHPLEQRPDNATWARSHTESVAASVSRAQRSRGPSIAGRIVVAVCRGIARLRGRRT